MSRILSLRLIHAMHALTSTICTIPGLPSSFKNKTGVAKGSAMCAIGMVKLPFFINLKFSRAVECKNILKLPRPTLPIVCFCNCIMLNADYLICDDTESLNGQSMTRSLHLQSACRPFKRLSFLLRVMRYSLTAGVPCCGAASLQAFASTAI